ncbi:DNA-dependent metalloprotease WSS1 [Microdochium nivale]|nr:DNA-dependent metalloprotease WSS1 [Microdochium nivale]
MGNLCSKSDGGDHFSQPGRALGTAPEQPTRVGVPASATRKVGGPPRTLGGSGGGGGSEGGAADEARRKAAEAAEARANALNTKSAGKLGAQLAAQKKQSRNETLQEISSNNTRQRDADETAEARIHS